MNPTIEPTDRCVLVTGSSRGIGRAIALRLARDGFDIVVHCHSDPVSAQAVCDEIRDLGRNSRVVQFDIGDRDATREALATDITGHGVYFGVVSNAGIRRDGIFAGMSGEAWDSVVHTNLDGFYNVLCPLVLPMTRKRRPGRIVTIASVAGLLGNRGQVNYSAAKAGIIGATKALALELAGRGITVNCVAPGLIDTEMTADLPTEEILRHVPISRMGKPEEVAAAVSFLMSDDAAYITRQVISVDGGMA